MSNPSNDNARRACIALTFSNVTSTESARQPVLLQGSVAVPADHCFDGYNLMRTGGTGGDIESTVRIWDAAAAGENIYQNAHTIGANDNAAGVTGLARPLNTETYSALNVSMQNDSGTDQDYTLRVYLVPVLAR